MINKRVCLIVFLGLILFSFQISALEISMRKFYFSEETMIGEIKGIVFEPIPLENIEFKRENIRVPLEYDVKKIGEDYFLWAVAPKSEGNYTLWIRNVATTLNGENTKVDFSYNFSVMNTSAEYTVVPGFILTSEDIEIDIRLNRDLEKNISLGEDGRNVFLQPGSNKVKISLQELANYNDRKLSVGTYLLPVRIIGDAIKEVVIKKGLSISPTVISKRIDNETNLTYFISIENSEEKEIKNIQFFYNESKFLIVPKGNFSLAANQTKYYNLTILNTSLLEDYEEIYARANNSYARLLIDISLRNLLQTDENDTNKTSSNKTIDQLRCSEIRGGRFCTKDQTCNGQSLNSLDGSCCVGTCTIKKKSGSNAWIGYVLGILWIGILGYVYYNYQKTKKKEGNNFNKKVEEAEKKLP